MADSDEAPDAAVSDSRQSHAATREAGPELPSVALVEAVAAAKDTDPVALDPIGSHFDMDALNALLESPGSEDGVTVTAEFQGVRASIDSDGTVQVRRTDADAPGADQ